MGFFTRKGNTVEDALKVDDLTDLDFQKLKEFM